MTTIDEMDEFFNFEGAADHQQLHPPQSPQDFSHLRSGPYDIDLAFAEPENDENSFTCLQHFNDSVEQELSSSLQNVVQGTNPMAQDGFTAQDFTDFPRWIQGMNFPFQPCANCKKMRIHCKVIKEGSRKGSCTSCVALARSCSLTYMPRVPTVNEDSYPGVDGVASSEHPQLPDTATTGNPFASSDASMNDNLLGDDFQTGLLNTAEFDADEALADWNDVLLSSGSGKPSKSPVEALDPYSHSNSASDLVALKSSSYENLNSDAAVTAPKAGARFPREAVRVLRGWLSTHHRHPYPTEEEKESLRRQTGLNKVQITNWLANARRRGKVRAPRSTSPSPNLDNYAKGMDIPRRGTPALQMNPMDRWRASPPEHEPASITAIAKAVTSSTYSSGHESPYASYGHTEDGSARSARSLCNVSTNSSLGTSHSSGGSFASAFSHKSRGSFGSFNSFGNKGRRRRRRQAPKPVKVSNLTIPPRTFQCTFCTETFKTKHDWQRHEKSLHLSLERWICSPNGPNQFWTEHNRLACVYCGLLDPPEGHAEQHNHSSCAERSLEERTFYRKDHLRQHLNLVHDAKFHAWSMNTWEVAAPEICSRCGFCGLVMHSWSIRVDHLAEHFKGGKSMADWKGDWGFETQVLDMVENGMPPYLIHDERNTLWPFEASKKSAESERTLEDLIKIGLVDFINDQVKFLENTLTDEDLLLEARKIILKADAVQNAPCAVQSSWFRDLIMLSGKNPRLSESALLEALAPAELTEKSWAERLEKINRRLPNHRHDLDSISGFKERALMTFVHSKQSVGLTPTDSELQAQACKILDDIEINTNFKCKGAVSWFKYLIVSEHKWLAEFRQRAGLPRSSEMDNEHIRSTDETTIDNSIHNVSRLENELKEYVRTQLAAGITPTDSDLQRKARLIIYNDDDPWSQTAAEDPVLLHIFKRQNGLAPCDEDGPDLPDVPEASAFGKSLLSPKTSSPRSLHWDLEDTGIGMIPSPVSGSDRQLATGSGTTTSAPNDAPLLHTLAQNQPSTNTNPMQPLLYFLNDANCYARLVRELSRFVTSCMSPNNPNQHVPTDAEIQNQARWVIYDDDDPWNQTAADNYEWLVRFKRDVGLIPSESGPGLPTAHKSWRVGNGGTGFSPPYLNPKAPPAPFTDDVAVKMDHKIYQVPARTAGKFLQSMGERWQKPAKVFCSRDLENGLGDFVKVQLASGVVPSDEELRAKAREILGVGETAAEDIQLLNKFKSMHGIGGSPTDMIDLSPVSNNNSSLGMEGAGPVPDFTLPNFTDDVDMLGSFDMELGDVDLTAFGTNTLPVSMPENSFVLGPDLGAMDISGLDVSQQNTGYPIPSSHSPNSHSLSNPSPSYLSAITPSLGVRANTQTGMDARNIGDGALNDYSEPYRVTAATASPLRRKASEKLAQRVGSSASPRGNLYAG